MLVPAFALMMIWLVIRALWAASNHDESQYVAAALLSRDHLVFRDFLSLQPPLHAWLMAPIAAFFPESGFAALRLATAATGFATLALLYVALRAGNATRGHALAAMLLMACCEPFQFASTVVRNDAAPALMLTAALLAGSFAIRRGGALPWIVTGFLLGLAGSTKLSYAPPLAAAGLFLLVQAARGRLPRGAPIGYAAGALAGLTPMLAALLTAPHAFLYGVLEFGATAPFEWYRANGLDHRLGWWGKLTDLAFYAAIGPALPALAIVLWDLVKGRPPSPSAQLDRNWLGWMLAAGMLAAALPTPAQRQYLVPMLPPLFLMLGFTLERIRALRPAWRITIQIMLILSAVLGVAKGAVTLAKRASGPTALIMDRDARWIGDQILRRGLTGPVASLSPERAASSGYPLDTRFATGPFVFRAGPLIQADRAIAMDVAIPRTLTLQFDRKPPAAILTGYEQGSRRFHLAPDDALIAYARRRGYRPIPTPDGIGMLYIRSSRRG